MGYDTELKGKILTSKKVSGEFFKWLETWCDMRHTSLATSNIELYDKDWQQKTPSGNLGREGILYADRSIPRCINTNDNKQVSFLEDYYFPLVPKKVEEEESSEYEIYFLASGLEKPYGVREWMDFFVNCEDITQHLGDISGVILGIGEEFGDAWYIAINGKRCEEIQAYTDGAKAKVEEVLAGNAEALKVFEEEAYVSPMELEYHWED